MNAAYLDASAFVKLVLDEAHSQALRTFLSDWPERVSSALLRAEGVRAVRPHGDDAVDHAREALDRIHLVGITDAVLDAAGVTPGLRTLDAIHVVTARDLGDELGVLVTYDTRMVDVARSLGLHVASPT